MPSMVRATFLQRLAYRPYESVDFRGREVHGELVENVPCRYQPSSRLIRDNTGQQVVESCVLFTEQPLTVKDLVWPPGTALPADPEDTSASMRPLAVYPRYGLLSTQVDHYEVHL